MPAAKRIVVIHAADRAMDQILAGIDEVRQDGRSWSFRHQYSLPRTPREIAEVQAWHPDGLISAQAPTPPALAACSWPWVSIRHRQSSLAVVLDEQAVGACAAAHLCAAGVATLACLDVVGENTGSWHLARRRGFVEEVSRQGRTAVLVPWGDVPQRTVLAGLAGLAKPVGLFTGNDWYALEILEMLQCASIKVPSEVALLGADDIPRCADTTVPLSSVRVPHRECGRRAALLLDRAMGDQVRRTELVVLRPDGVSERASTDPVAVADGEVASVIRYIRLRIGEPFGVADAIAASNLSRRSLEMRFRAVLGRTILDEIHRQRVERAKLLLRTGNSSILEIANGTGFTGSAHFSIVFKRATGLSPSAFRTAERRR